MLFSISYEQGIGESNMLSVIGTSIYCISLLQTGYWRIEQAIYRRLFQSTVPWII